MLITRGFVDNTIIVRGFTSSIDICRYKEIVEFLSPITQRISKRSIVIDGTGNCLF